MKKQRVFLTGATGAMGFLGLNELLKDVSGQEIVTLARPSQKNRKMLEPYKNTEGLTIYWGDLTHYEDVYKCVKDADLILHVAAFVSPAADYYPEEAMKINFGSTRNILRAIEEQGRKEDTALVYIGTVAETGDRMPPIHWGPRRRSDKTEHVRLLCGFQGSIGAARDRVRLKALGQPAADGHHRPQDE